MTDEDFKAIRDSIKPGDGWGGDDWDRALAEATVEFISRKYSREKFEMYCEQQGLHDLEYSSDDANNYRNPFTQGKWIFWRASRDAMRSC